MKEIINMYNHNELEKKWLKYWEENQTYKFKDELDKKKFYILNDSLIKILW